jgi:hypothetical protein
VRTRARDKLSPLKVLAQIVGHQRHDTVNLPALNRETQQLYLHQWQILLLQVERPIADTLGADGRSEQASDLGHPNQPPDCGSRLRC